MKFRKPTLIPLLFIICSTLLLGSLGSWQVVRLQWKLEQIEALEHAQAAPALGTLPESLEGLEYRNVLLTGRFLEGTIRRAGGKQGYPYGHFIVTPLELIDDGRIIMVNRGYAPLDTDVTIQGIQTVRGILRAPRQKRLFTPENAIQQNIWFHEDLAQIEAYIGKAVVPLIVEATGEYEANTYPIPHNNSISLRNDHLGYAITWFMLMIAGLVMFVFYHKEPDTSKTEN